MTPCQRMNFNYLQIGRAQESCLHAVCQEKKKKRTCFTDITSSLLLREVGLATGKKTSRASSSIKGLFFLAAARTRMQDFTVLSAVLSLGFFWNKGKGVRFSKHPELQRGWVQTHVPIGVRLCTHLCILSQVYTHFLSQETSKTNSTATPSQAVVWVF